MSAGRARHSVVVPALFACTMLAAFLALGVWQLQRKAWKEALIGALEARLAAAPVDLPARERWGSLAPDADEFRRVKFTATFVPGEEALVYTSGSAFRPDISGVGYWVFAPARLAAGGTIVVNRGFVPEGRQNSASRRETPPSGEMVGVLRWPEVPGRFAPKDDAAHNLWFVRDHLAIARARGWGDVAPFFVELESPQPPGGLPQAGPLKVKLRNEHLQYAITWFGLAAVVVVMFAVWLCGRRKGSDAA